MMLPDYVFVDEHNRHKRLKGKRKTVLARGQLRLDRLC